MGYHPALTAYVQKNDDPIQAGSVVFLTDSTPGNKRRREDAVYINADNAPTAGKFAFAIDDISNRENDCVSLQTYGLLSAFVVGSDLKVGMPVYPMNADHNPKNVHLTTDAGASASSPNGYAGYIVSIDGAPEKHGVKSLTVCRVFVDTCRHMA